MFNTRSVTASPARHAGLRSVIWPLDNRPLAVKPGEFATEARTSPSGPTEPRQPKLVTGPPGTSGVPWPKEIDPPAIVTVTGCAAAPHPAEA